MAADGSNHPNHRQAGRHFLQIPGPTNVPDRVLRAMDNPTMDHRGPEFGKLGREILANLRQVFRTKGPVVIYPASGTGAWEAALVNTLSPGDAVLMCRTGWFASLWKEMAEKLGLKPEFIDTDWRHGADVAAIGAALAEDRAHRIKAVCVVHNETSTGCTSRIDEVRRAIDAAGHPALLMVDTISSLASIDYRHDEWGVDVTVAGSQKGLMLPPGLSFNAISEKALRARRKRAAAAELLGLAADAERERDRLFPLHAGHEPALRPERGGEDAARGGLAERVRAARSACGGNAAGRAGLGARDPVRGAAALFLVTHGRTRSGGA